MSSVCLSGKDFGSHSYGGVPATAFVVLLRKVVLLIHPRGCFVLILRMAMCVLIMVCFVLLMCVFHESLASSDCRVTVCAKAAHLFGQGSEECL